MDRTSVSGVVQEKTPTLYFTYEAPEECPYLEGTSGRTNIYCPDLFFSLEVRLRGCQRFEYQKMVSGDLKPVISYLLDYYVFLQGFTFFRTLAILLLYSCLFAILLLWILNRQQTRRFQ